MSKDIKKTKEQLEEEREKAFQEKLKELTLTTGWTRKLRLHMLMQ